MKTEPATIVSGITAAATAIIALLVAFGIPLTDEQTAAILAVVAVAAPLVAGLIVRRFVTPAAAVAEKVVDGQIIAGPANDRVQDGAVVRDLDDVRERARRDLPDSNAA